MDGHLSSHLTPQIISSVGHLIGSVHNIGKHNQPYGFRVPTITVDPEYTVDASTHRILVFKPTLKLLHELHSFKNIFKDTFFCKCTNH
jgi:hypothetical protein